MTVCQTQEEDRAVIETVVASVGAAAVPECVSLSRVLGEHMHSAGND